MILTITKICAETLIIGEILMNISANINECLSSPCVNGECDDAVSSYECACAIDWSGIHCEGL